MTNLLKTKPLDVLMRQASETGEHSLKRALGPVNLITLGIGAIIGAGIFVLTGQAAAQYAGPGIMLSYVLAGTGCAFAGLCYAEFASMIPIAGSAYTYGYATLGEIFAWIIGWDLILEYAFGAATVASGWSSTLVAFLQDYGINLPPQICDVPGAKWSMVDGRWAPDLTLSMDQMMRATQHTTTIFNFMAFFAIIAVTTILIVGIKESANFNTTIVFVKLIAVIVFIIVAGMYVIKQPDVAHANWAVFLPKNTGSFGSFGWSGVLRGAGVVFFAYIGFDAVSTAAQEARNPQKDMPIGILGSLVDLHRALPRRLRPADRDGALLAPEHRRSGFSGHPRDRREVGQLRGECRRARRSLHGDAGNVAWPIARLLLHGARRPAVEVGGRHPSQVPDAVEVHRRDRYSRRLHRLAGAHWRPRPDGLHRHADGLRHRLRRRLGDAPQPA